MPTTTVKFRIPPDIAGQIGGRYHLFGGVVRDNAGRVVRMLEPMARDAGQAARKDLRVAVVALAVAAVAGGSVYLYTRLNKRARLARKLEQVDEALAPGMRNAELTKEDLATLRNAIADFLNVATSATYRDVRLSVPQVELQKLRTLAAALAEFSAGLRSTKDDDPAPPALPDESSDLLSLLASVRDQVEYQTRRWPVAEA